MSIKEPVRDRYGNVIPRAIREAFALAAHVAQTKKAMLDANKGADGMIPYSELTDAVNESTDRLIADFLPWCVCPTCSGTGRQAILRKGIKCRLCKGAGWITKKQFEKLGKILSEVATNG